MLLPRLQRVVTQWDPGARTEMPSVGRGTFVIWNVDVLDACAQRQLIDVLDRPHRVQVISVAPVDLFERVKRGDFLEALYYRLNTVRVHLQAG
jgi:DNA-binding NtrC family response regulator